MITWNKEIEDCMKRHAEDTYPFECCGFIVGTNSNRSDEAVFLIPADNSHNGEKRRRFHIDPISYMKAEKLADKDGLSIIGVYHSHPDHPPIPSEEDRIHALPGFHYPIISVVKGNAQSVKSWVLEDSRKFKEVTIFKNQ